MKTIKVFLIAIPVSFGLFGCFFASTWGKVESASVFTWQQVPETRFYINIGVIVAIALFLIYQYAKTPGRSDLKGLIIMLIIPLLVIALMVARAVNPASLTLDDNQISTRQGFAGGLDKHKIVNMNIVWGDVDNITCYGSDNTEVTHWSSGGDTQEETIQEGIQISGLGGLTMDIPLRVEDHSPVYFVTTGIFGDEDFNISLSQRLDLLHAIQSHLPSTATINGCTSL
jgi:hypothetical protein